MQLVARAVVLVSSLTACYAQGDRGLITGLVKDTSGAAMVGAAIRAKHLATGVDTTTQTHSQGN
jgi:hypothetical protein